MSSQKDSPTLDADANANASDAPSLSQSQSTTHAYPHWHDFIAGAAAGVGARAFTAPLDLLKIRLQLEQPSSNVTNKVSTKRVGAAAEWHIFQHLHSIAEKEGGIRSLFRGNVAASYLWMGYSVTQFWLYGYTSEYLHQQYDSLITNEHNSDVKISGAISFTSGAISGTCATVITYPFDLCRTIFAARGLTIPASNVTWSNHTTNLASMNQQYVQRRPPKTLSEFAHQMYQQKGIKGFYAGSTPGLLQIVPYMGLNFALHDMLMMVAESSDSRLSGMVGMGAGVISKFLVYPLDTVKKRLQAQAFWSPTIGDGTMRKSTKYNDALPKNASMYSNRKRVIVGAVNRGVASAHQPSGPVVYHGMVDCFQQIAKREGMSAFYKGLTPSLIKSAASTGASFWLFTLTRNVLRSVHDS